MADFLTIIHECKDFRTWRAVHDGDAAHWRAAGLTELFLLQSAGDPNRVALAFGVGDPAKAKAMVTSGELRETMQRAGVVGGPLILFRRGDYAHQEAANYLSIICKVSGLETFQKGYAMDKADREAASLTDLGWMQSVDDPRQLLLLLSVGDVAKAKAFLTSSKLAEHQVKNAGFIGDPLARFWVK